MLIVWRGIRYDLVSNPSRSLSERCMRYKKIIVGRDKLDVVKGVLQKVCRYLPASVLRSLLGFDVLTAHM
jgi:hypothetical protein